MEDGEDHQQEATRKGRGEAKLRFLSTLQSNQKIPIEVEEGVPIGPNSANLSSYVGYLARDGNKLPLPKPTFKQFTKETIAGIIRNVKEIFDLPPELDGWVRNRLNERWKDHKAEIKKKYFDPYETKDERLAHRPPQVSESDWKILEASKRNKRNRSKQKIHHKAS